MSEQLKILFGNKINKLVNNTITIDEAIFCYIFINFQFYIYLSSFSIGYEKMNENYKINDKTKICEMNENEYLKFCEDSKIINEIKNNLIPIIILIINKISKEELEQKINTNKTLYYNTDGTFNENDINEYDSFILKCIKDDLLL